MSLEWWFSAGGGGYLTVSAGIFGSHVRGSAAGAYWVETRDAAQQPATLGTAPHDGQLSGPECHSRPG